jgi:hypothetical protein
VAAEARYRAKSLLATASDEVRSQASTQQSRLAEAVHSLSKELGGMASSSPESGPLTDLAHQASRKGGEIAHWLENREPADVLDEVRAFARRRPVMFLGLCALAGIVAGRLTRGAVAANTGLDSKTDASPRRLSSADSYYAPPSAGYSTEQTGYAGSAPGAAGDYAAGVPQTGYSTGMDYSGSGQAGGYTTGVPQSGYPTGTDYPATSETAPGGYTTGVPQSGYPTGIEDTGSAPSGYPAEGGYTDQQGGGTESAPNAPTTGAAGGMPSSGSGYAEEEGRRQPYGGESNR